MERTAIELASATERSRKPSRCFRDAMRITDDDDNQENKFGQEKKQDTRIDSSKPEQPDEHIETTNLRSTLQSHAYQLTHR